MVASLGASVAILLCVIILIIGSDNNVPGDRAGEESTQESGAVAPEAPFLKAEPSWIAVPVGERTPPIRLTTWESAPIDLVNERVRWVTENEAVLAPDPEAPGRFVGREAGNTRLVAAFRGLRIFIDVAVFDDTVVDDIPLQITLGKGPESVYEDRFTISVEVEAAGHHDAGLEFRVVSPGAPDEGKWKRGVPSGSGVKVKVISPRLRLGTKDHSLLIEARDKEQRIVARYPRSFGFVIK